MNLFERAGRSCCRKPVRSLLLLFVVCLISLLFLSGMASRSANIGAKDSTRQAIGAEHVLHHVDVCADVEGIAGKQLIQLRLKCLDKGIHRLLNAVLGLRDILALDALLVKLGVGIEQL